jgi:hypothetical protein
VRNRGGHHLGTLLLTLGVGSALVGCQSQPRPVQAHAQFSPEEFATAFPGLSEPEPFDAVEAVVAPPAGWRAEPLKTSDRHNHQVWISPSGNTAYGVIRFKLPWPVGPDAVLRFGFMPEMRRTEGEATLISSERDPELPGLRFVAEGGKYRLRTNMLTRGWKGWAIYAGTLREYPIDFEELSLAEVAREHTTVGLPKRVPNEVLSSTGEPHPQPGS